MDIIIEGIMENHNNQHPFKRNSMETDVGRYTEEHFIKYITDKYEIPLKTYLESKTVLKMIYSLEWFNIK